MPNTIVQYVVVRTDLVTAMDWSIGSIIAQACHATTVSTQIYKDDPHTKKYLEDLDNMHKVRRTG